MRGISPRLDGGSRAPRLPGGPGRLRPTARRPRGAGDGQAADPRCAPAGVRPGLRSPEAAVETLDAGMSGGSFCGPTARGIAAVPTSFRDGDGLMGLSENGWLDAAGYGRELARLADQLLDRRPNQARCGRCRAHCPSRRPLQRLVRSPSYSSDPRARQSWKLHPLAHRVAPGHASPPRPPMPCSSPTEAVSG